jgi:hypothetical protein
MKDKITKKIEAEPITTEMPSKSDKSDNVRITANCTTDRDGAELEAEPDSQNASASEPTTEVPFTNDEPSNIVPAVNSVINKGGIKSEPIATEIPSKRTCRMKFPPRLMGPIMEPKQSRPSQRCQSSSSCMWHVSAPRRESAQRVQFRVALKSSRCYGVRQTQIPDKIRVPEAELSHSKIATLVMRRRCISATVLDSSTMLVARIKNNDEGTGIIIDSPSRN